MNLLSYQYDPRKHRFPLPNAIWKWDLKPPAFAVLAYLQYRTCRKLGRTTSDEIARRTRMSVDMAQENIDKLVNGGLLTAGLIPVLPDTGNGMFFTLPDELFALDIGPGAIAVYAYLLYCEDRRTHQCHPSYNTISAAVRLAVNTVMKHINKLADRQFISVEHTSYIDRHGMKQKGNNLYTILSIQCAVDAFHRRQLERLEATAKVQRKATQHMAMWTSPPTAPL